jgi:hypothetical protein
MNLGLVLGLPLLLLTLGCRAGSHPAPVAAPPSPCAFAQSDAAGWHEITKDLTDLTFAVPPEFVPDTSLGAKVATYHGGEQLTAPPRAIFYSSFGEGDFRLDGDWVRDSIYQTPNWPTLGPGWRTRVASNDRPKPDDPVVLSAWMPGRRSSCM